MKLLSIIIPVYNEVDNITPLCEALARYCKADYEVIFIDDGSTDGTLAAIEDISRKNANIKCISLSKNFGHQNALMAGMEYAAGEYIITMDGDLQHPPALIPEMLDKLNEGFDLVNTRRKTTERIGFIKKS